MVASAVVIDLGSLSVRAEFARDDCPRAVFPTIDTVQQCHNSSKKKTAKVTATTTTVS